MSDPTDKKDDPAPTDAKPKAAQDDDHLEDEEKVLAGRHDVNYPALLTKDVPGG